MRVFVQHSNEIAVRNNILESSRIAMKTAGNTGVAQQGFGQYCLNVLAAQKMKPFLWNYGMFVTQKIV